MNTDTQTKGTWMVAAAGLFGALGVASAAGAAHADPNGLLAPASAMLLAHAPTLIGLYAARTRIAFVSIAAFILFAGTLIFTTDLALAYYGITNPFPMAAPIGGVLMISGWLVVIVCAFFPVRTTGRPKA